MAFCSNLFRGVRNLLGKVDGLLKKYLPIAVESVNFIKGVVEDPLLRTVTDLTSTKLDDRVRLQVSIGLNVVLNNVLEIKDCIDRVGPDKAKCFIAYMRALSPTFRDAIYFKIASELVRYLHLDKLNQSDYDTIVQSYYYSMKRK